MRALTFVFGMLLLACWNAPARADLLVASFDSFEVLRYDGNTGAFFGAFATGSLAARPLAMSIGPDGKLYISMADHAPPVFQDFIARFDAQTGAFIDVFASVDGLGPAHHLVFGPDGNLYVAIFGGTSPNSRIARYNGITGAFIDDFVPVGSGGLKGAEGLVFGPDENLYVTSRDTNEVLRYDGSTGAFLDVFASAQNKPVDLVFGPDGDLYVLESSPTSDLELEVLRFDGSTGAFIDVFVGPFSGGTDGTSLAFGPDGNLYVTTGHIGDSVRRFHGSTGQFIDDFVPRSSGGLDYAVGLLFLNPIAHGISIDIKPGSKINPINPKSKSVIQVAILTTSGLDATTVDVLSVRFGPNEAKEARGRVQTKDVNGDGRLDLVLHFKTEDTGIQCGATTASLTAETVNGQAIEGSDSIKTVGCKKR